MKHPDSFFDSLPGLTNASLVPDFSKEKNILERLFYQEKDNALSSLTGELILIRGLQHDNAERKELLEEILRQDPHATGVRKSLATVEQPWKDQKELTLRVDKVLADLRLFVAGIVNCTKLSVSLRYEGLYDPDSRPVDNRITSIARQKMNYWRGYSLTVKLDPPVIVSDEIRASGYTRLLFQIYNGPVVKGTDEILEPFFRDPESVTLASILTCSEASYIPPRNKQKDNSVITIPVITVVSGDIHESVRRESHNGELYISTNGRVVHSEKQSRDIVDNLAKLGYAISYAVDDNEPPVPIKKEKQTVL